MIGFARTDRSALGQWWWTVDRWTLAAVIALMFVGAILVLAASPAVATRIGLDSFYLVRHHYMMLPAAAAVLIAVSVLTPRQVRRLGFERMSFLQLSAAAAIDSPSLPAEIDVVTALHACDTATDDAIAFGLRRHARAMALVPCCQAEIAGCLRQGKALSLARTPLAELWRHPLHTRELGSQLTNVLRCLYLEAWGYQVTVTELVGWEHSLKNELILAHWTGQRKRSAAERLQAILREFGLESLIGVRFQLP